MAPAAMFTHEPGFRPDSDSPSHARIATRRSPARGWSLLLALALAASFADPAAAQRVKPWIPPAADTTEAWAAEARVAFQTLQGDSARGPNHKPYELVGRIARRLLRTLGQDGTPQALAIQPALDSLGLDTDVVIDPESPGFVFVMVRNPYRPAAEAVGFLCWYRESDLRVQGVVFTSGYEPRFRVWWTARSKAPYACGVITRGQPVQSPLALTLLRLNADGRFWNLLQYEGYGPDLGTAGRAFWAEVNNDGAPEIVSWSRTHPDSTFQECQGCPGLLTERIFVDREAGFELQDSRLLPSPYATFHLFVNLLRDRNRAAATRLLVEPKDLDRAIALGWGLPKGTWKLEYAEQEQPWPRWLALRHTSAKGAPLYIVHFALRDGRWIISRWLTPTAAPAPRTGEGGK